MFAVSADLENFNSTMVRLKVVDVHVLRVAPRLFQFHYGSIKSLPPDLQKHFPSIDFNSTMVRLKVADAFDVMED